MKNFMRKSLMMCSLLTILSACVYSGPVNFLDSRRRFVESFSSYPISYRDNSPRLVKSQSINEKSFKRNEIRTAFKGYSVLSDKTFNRSYFVTERLKANGNIVLSNSSAPYILKNNQQKEILATTYIDGVDYNIITTELDKFVLLVNAKTGKLFKQTGMIKDDRLVLLRQDFVPSNENFRFEPVFVTTTEQSKPNKGFDIKFDGLRLNRMWFVYYDYASSKSGGFQEYDFPNKPGLININGVKVRVLAVDEQRVDYMVLSD